MSRRQGPGGRARQLPRLRRGRRRPGAPQGARQGGSQHRAPAAELRHRLDRGGPGQAADAAVRPRVVRARQRGAAEVRRRRRGQGRLQLGLRPVPLQRARRLVRLERQGGRRRGPRRRVPHDGRGAAPGRPAGRARRGLQPHGRSRARATSRCSTRSCPATTSASTRPAPSRPRRAARTSRPSTRWREKLMVDSWCHVGARLQGRRLPLRPHGPPQQGEHARRARRRSTR